MSSMKLDSTYVRIGVAIGRASGQISLCKIHGVHHECALELTDLYVDPSARGRGWGHRLIDTACRHADEHQIVLTLMVRPFGRNRAQRIDADALKKLYAQHGFEDTSDGSWSDWDMFRRAR